MAVKRSISEVDEQTLNQVDLRFVHIQFGEELEKEGYEIRGENLVFFDFLKFEIPRNQCFTNETTLNRLVSTFQKEMRKKTTRVEGVSLYYKQVPSDIFQLNDKFIQVTLLLCDLWTDDVPVPAIAALDTWTA